MHLLVFPTAHVELREEAEYLDDLIEAARLVAERLRLQAWRVRVTHPRLRSLAHLHAHLTAERETANRVPKA